jgi:hypothetical protein
MASKALRNLISWWLERRHIAFPCGELWYDWDSMTISLPGKFKEMESFGVDLTSPRTMVASILEGGRNLPAGALRALQELMFRKNDYDLGCLACENGSFSKIISGLNALGSARNVLALLPETVRSGSPEQTGVLRNGGDAQALAVRGMWRAHDIRVPS